MRIVVALPVAPLVALIAARGRDVEPLLATLTRAARVHAPESSARDTQSTSCGTPTTRH